jgi:hypothetical protein
MSPQDLGRKRTIWTKARATAVRKAARTVGVAEAAEADDVRVRTFARPTPIAGPAFACRTATESTPGSTPP